MRSSGALRALLVLGIAQLGLGVFQYFARNAQGATVSLLCGAALVLVALIQLRKV